MKLFLAATFIIIFQVFYITGIVARNSIYNEEKFTKRLQRSGNHQEKPITYVIVKSPNNTFGYHIIKDNRVLIRQTSIPGRAGTAGFKTKTDAENVAKAVIIKIKKRQMPPTLTKQEVNAIIHY